MFRMFKIMIACYCSDCRETTIFEPRLCSSFLMFSVNEQFKCGRLIWTTSVSLMDTYTFHRIRENTPSISSIGRHLKQHGVEKPTFKDNFPVLKNKFECPVYEILFIQELNPRGYSWEFLVEVCRPVLQILTLFQTKTCNFPHPFSDQTFRRKLCYHSLDYSANKKIL